MVKGVRSSLVEVEAEMMRTGPGDGRWGRTRPMSAPASALTVELVLAGSGEKLPGALCVGPGVPLPLMGCIDCRLLASAAFTGALSMLPFGWSSGWWCLVMDHTVLALFRTGYPSQGQVSHLANPFRWMSVEEDYQLRGIVYVGGG